ncbi:MAG: hypothetical protein B9S32_02725 [Verrucomicrobia bacterium Tous-C9LFEB]|nr:MAG: hypothetical protein B9S32_02725 [Verrucomicrobia bacterium Tous-C9LFEB]
MAQRFPPTLADVGRLAGFTAATVSMALHNDPRISARTKERVLKAAEKLHYRPDPMLSALSSRRKPESKRRVLANIAAIVDDRWMKVSKEWVNDLLEIMKVTSYQLGYDLDVLYVDRDLAASTQPDRLLRGRGIRGMIIFPLYDGELHIDLDWEQYSVIALGIHAIKHNFNRVGSNAFMAMNITCQHLYELGYRKVGLAHVLDQEKRTRYEWIGSLAKEQYRRPPRFKLVKPYLPDDFIESKFVDWVKKEKPECVITSDVRAVSFLRNAGYRVPEEIGLSLLTPSYETPEITAGVGQHHSQIGATAIEQLHGMLMRGECGIPKMSKETLIHPLWINGPTVRQVR